MRPVQKAIDVSPLAVEAQIRRRKTQRRRRWSKRLLNSGIAAMACGLAFGVVYVGIFTGLWLHDRWGILGIVAPVCGMGLVLVLVGLVLDDSKP